eukprot:TRINITY_DN5228_c0_g1_i1.p1 TRINITY_DN5228_c0_g1~~TRINITY_DN5228_c0_g1_i1.p1  ORF type:complete len:408 (-),score=119.43 TRINITY_DN5228_c0_g1_i1:75-1262(-)
MATAALFEENLWGDNGYDTVERLSNTSSDVLGQFESFLKERVELEDNYVKHLKKLTEPASGFLKSNDGIPELLKTEPLTTLRECWAALKEENNSRMEAHRDLFACLSKMLTATRDYRKEQLKLKKQQLTDAAAVIRERGMLEGAIKKVKLRYADCINRAQGAQSAVETAQQQKRPAPEIAKMAMKHQKLSREEMTLDQEYKEAIHALQEFHPQFVTSIQTFLRTMESYEKDRVLFVQQQLASFCSMLQQMAPRNAEARSRLEQSAVNINVEKDLSEWVQSNKTESSPPVPPTYVPKMARSRLQDVEGSAPRSASPNPSLTRAQSQSVMVEPAAPLCVVQALYDFVGDESDELDFFTGETFAVLDKDGGTGWWVGTNYGRTAWFPSSFVKEVPNST